jgi:hypothetical protein
VSDLTSIAGGAADDRFEQARAVADAVLYEGYVLYPYRASAPKNQLRWQFGVLAPRAVNETDGSERWSMRTECLAQLHKPGLAEPATLWVRVRCLHVQHRSVEVPATPSGVAAADDGYVPVDRIEIDGKVHVAWDEAVERVLDTRALPLADFDALEHVESFRLPEGSDVEAIEGAAGGVAGRVVRTRQPVSGRVRVAIEQANGPGSLMKIVVTVENTTDWYQPAATRDEVMAHSLVAVHVMLAADGASFLSMLDPPAPAQQAVVHCTNDGVFPVLIGDDQLMLASPIILYDHPAVAAESPGDLYDATEIDEILALRVLTLTDEEKSEARGTDPRSAAIVDRCDQMGPDAWSRLHGTVRPLADGDRVRPLAGDETVRPLAGGDDDPRPSAPPRWTPSTEDAHVGSTGLPGVDAEPVPWWDPVSDESADPFTGSVTIAGVVVTKGSPVRLEPSHRADAHDVFLRGMAATVAGVFSDVDGGEHVAVTIDDDPASSELLWQGRFLFFHPDELVPLLSEDGAR